jgi:hypothetical protein
MSNEDVEREVARRVASYQAALTKGRREVESMRGEVQALKRELADATRLERYNRHECPTQKQLQAAMKSRDDAFRALAEVKERHEPRDAKYCRCGVISSECSDQQLVLHYPAFKSWEHDQRVSVVH